MRKPKYLQIKVITGRVEEDFWLSYDAIENMVKKGRNLDGSHDSQCALATYHLMNKELFDRVVSVVERNDFLLSIK